MITLQWQKLHHDALAPLNAYGDDAGWDLHVLEDTWIEVNGGADVRTGVAVAIPSGYYGRIIGRSSALRNKHIQVQEGIIDCGWRGELYSYAWCLASPWTVMRGGVQLERGESIAQLIVSPVPALTLVEVASLPESARGEKGFGSSGR